MVLVIPHVPKTGGTSVRHWLANALGRDEIFWHGEDGNIEAAEHQSLLRYRAIGGHFPAGTPVIKEIETHLSPSRPLFVYIMREPKSQFVSFSSYVSVRPGHPLYQGPMFEAYLKTDTSFFLAARNMQCSYISENQTYEMACDWIAAHDVVCADTRDLSEIRGPMSAYLDIDLGPMPFENVSPSHFDEGQVGGRLSEFVSCFLAEDLKLYDAMLAGKFKYRPNY